MSESPKGSALIDTVVSLTGLPKPLIQKELDKFLEARGHDRNTITLDELRQVLLAYLETVQADFLTEKQQYNA